MSDMVFRPIDTLEHYATVELQLECETLAKGYRIRTAPDSPRVFVRLDDESPRTCSPIAWRPLQFPKAHRSPA